MSRMTKTLKAVQRELQSVKPSAGSPRALDISSIEKASFFQGDQYSPHGNPLHSTALEEDLSPRPEQNRRPAVETHQTNEKARVVPKSASSKEPSQTPDPGAASVGRKAKGRPLPTIAEGRENTAERGAAGAEKAGKGQRSSKETSPTPGVSLRRRSPASSEELTDEDESFHLSKEKSKGAKRRSSSRRQSGHKHKRTSASASAGPAKTPRDLRSPTDLDVVLETFQEFVTQYKQTMNSDAAKRSVDAVSRSFEEQISEIITATKQLKTVKRENNKINRDVNQKRTRLVEASYELIKAKTALRDLQKDHDGMELRLRSLREGSSLLSSLRELNRKYLKHRTDHPTEVETYGPSCMPAMLMEARCIMGTEHQLKTVNDNLQQVLDETENQ
ncbi:hypothetical protein R3I93_015116 [Phoxinus phoxinus]|uniref:Centromere protein U n=1 Tax=Phoxinus phoxinus TaxID=58324 RepID=A0AAN9H021_9TELE